MTSGDSIFVRFLDSTASYFVCCSASHKRPFFMYFLWLFFFQRLLANRADVNAASITDGATPLYIAAISSFFQGLEINSLLGNLVSLNFNQILEYYCISLRLVCSHCSKGPLFCFTWWFSFQTLLAYGADVKAALSSNRATPLYAAASSGYSQCVEVNFVMHYFLCFASSQILGYRCIYFCLGSCIKENTLLRVSFVAVFLPDTLDQ